MCNENTHMDAVITPNTMPLAILPNSINGSKTAFDFDFTEASSPDTVLDTPTHTNSSLVLLMLILILVVAWVLTLLILSGPAVNSKPAKCT